MIDTTNCKFRSN